MSWLTRRVQTERLRGKNKKHHMKGILRLMRMRVGGTLVQPKGEKGGQA
jgi:hypothetical protein